MIGVLQNTGTQVGLFRMMHTVSSMQLYVVLLEVTQDHPVPIPEIGEPRQKWTGCLRISEPFRNDQGDVKTRDGKCRPSCK